MHDSERTADISIAYVGGGSLNWAQTFMCDLAADGRIGGDVRLYDLDLAAAQRNAVIGNRIAAAAAGARVTYRAVADPAEALTGADVVIISILPGTFDDMANDIAIPQRFGIVQSVGDTVGPGGMVRGMRAIPAIAAIGRLIGEHAPDAYVCNLSNPMSMLTGALFAAYPGVKAWGECHEVTKLRKIVAHLAGEADGRPRHFRDADVNVLGINHFTWVTAASVDGRDMMPAYRAFAAVHRETGWLAKPRDPASEFDRYFVGNNRVKFDLACRFGAAAAAGDRHLAEFVPQSWYLDRAEEWGFTLTPIDYRKRDRARRVERAEALAHGGELPPPRRSEEAMLDEIAALCGIGDFVTNVNLPNHGQMAGFLADAIVETNARFSSAGITPLLAGRLPAAVDLMVSEHARRQSATVEAVLDGRRDDIFALLITDPQVAPLGPDRARVMFDEMTAATAHCLPRNLAA